MKREAQIIIKQKIKLLEVKQQACYIKANKFGAEITLLREELKTVCNHPYFKFVSQSWIEEGRMSQPARWEEKVCTVCGKILATSHEEKKIIWSDE